MANDVVSEGRGYFRSEVLLDMDMVLILRKPHEDDLCRCAGCERFARHVSDYIFAAERAWVHRGVRMPPDPDRWATEEEWWDAVRGEMSECYGLTGLKPLVKP